MKARVSRVLCVASGIVGGMAATCSPSWALDALKTIPDLSDTQRPVAVAIDSLCPNLVAPNVNGNGQERLSASCTKLVASKLNAPLPFNIGLSDADLKTALERYGGKENTRSGRVAIDSPGNRAIQGRFFQLHGGSTGFNLTQSTFDGVGGHGIAYSGAETRRGGAAGAGSRLGGFLNVNYGKGSKDGSSRETGFDFSASSAAAGVDYRITDNFVGGVSFAYSRNKSDFDLGLGDVKDRVTTLSLYGSYYLKDAFYLDGHLGYGRHKFDTLRRIVVVSRNANAGVDATATSSGVDGRQQTAFLSAGFNQRLGAATLTPYASLGHLKLDVDAFSESEPTAGMALSVGKQSVKSLQTALGLRLSGVVSTGMGVLAPQVFVAAHHEFENKSRAITARFVNDPASTLFAIPTESPDRSFYTFGLGVAGTFANGLSAFLNYETVWGLRDVTNHMISAGVRAEW